MQPRCCTLVRRASQPVLETLECRKLFSSALFSTHIQFEPAGTAVPSGYTADTGAVYGDRGNSLVYGWNVDNSANTRTRHSPSSPDANHDSFTHMQKPVGAREWDMAVPDGTYLVHILSGDPSNTDSVFRLDAEGTLVVNGSPSKTNHWVEGAATVIISNGKLTITNGVGAYNNKICSIDAQQLSTSVDPGLNPHLTWHAGTAMPIARTEASDWIADGKLFVFGGFYDGKLDASTELDSYDPATNTWTRLADCPIAVNDCPATYDALTDTAWMGGTYVNGDTTASGEIYSYSIKTNTWTQGPSLPEDIGAGQMAVVGRELHYFGGRLPNSQGQATHWRMDLDNPKAGWVDDTAMPATANHFGTAVVNGKIYAIGGIQNKQEATGNLTAVWIYDPGTRLWSAGAPLPVGLGHIAPSTTVVNGMIVIAGGEMNGKMSNYTNKVLEYDTAANTWSYLPNLPLVRSSAIVAYINGKLIVAGGNLPGSPYVTNQVWVGF